MKFTQKQIVIVAAGVVLVLAVVAAVYFGLRPTGNTQKITLTVWGTDPKSVFSDMASAYKAVAPNVTVDYLQDDPATYAGDLLKAFAAGTGPDIFEVGDHDLPKWYSVMAPAPATLTPAFTAATVAGDFPTVVTQNFVAGGQVYALPLSLDTLAMYYNKDLFDSAGIVYPPKTWNDLDSDIPKLRTLNAQGQITQAAVALGGSGASIADAPDILFLLMLQNGTNMVSNDGTAATFASVAPDGSNPGLAAFNFYLQFANSASPNYTWNDAMGDSMQNFLAGKTAIVFDYASAMSEIKEKAPFLDYGVAPMLQPASATIAVNYPSYQGLAVSKRGQVDAAWQFIIYMTTTPAAEEVYLKDMAQPPAGRSLIAAALTDPTYGTFAAQALTARAWYEADDAQIDSIMDAAIENVLNGSSNAANALGVAQNAITTVMRGQ
ncbi:MAG TPA: extracellular solute-binding protein [Candidatus Paceibacterota bacterium]|nr:extracellular solute-binding protein [Candidatus Paceibacterota bacterium]